MLLRRLLIISQWNYPAGGGEAFLHDSALWLPQTEWEVFWISFQKFDCSPNKKFEMNCDHRGITMLLLPSIDLLEGFIRLLKPDIIHHQGNMRMEILTIAECCRIPLITGFHFWTDAIILHNNGDNNVSNRNIRQNIDKHGVSENLEKIVQKSAGIYTCSEFIRDVVTEVSGYYISDVIFPIPELPTFKQRPFKERHYITLINIHPLKGGNMLLQLLSQLDYPFLIVESEPIKDDFRQQIYNALADRPDCLLLGYQQNMLDIYSKTRILLIPSEVDETFCRVCIEGMMTKTAIITTGNGNIRNLVGVDYPFICSTNAVSDWINAIKLLYGNAKRNNEVAKMLYNRYIANFNIQTEKNKFINLIHKSIANYSNNCAIGILTTWCDQGLGIQCRNYANILCNEHRKQVVIFSFKPYIRKSAQDLQSNLDEWNGQFRVYYSQHTREEITEEEIREFVEKNRISRMIIPETCWFRIFEIAKLLRELNVITYAIPNIEIVRKDEMFKHKYFDYILANNRLCERIFTEHGFTNVVYLGYGTPPVNSNNKTANKQLKFLFIGGLNGFSRKQCLEVCRSFNNINQNASKLTITLMSDNIDERIYEYQNNPCINIIIKHLSYQEIQKLYQSHDIFIQVSKHEGLGLGFYDAIANGVPTLTLDTAPHNEIITDEIGWRIPCHYVPMKDNNDSFIESAFFSEQDLTNKMQEIINNGDMKTNVRDYCVKNYETFVGKMREIFCDLV